MKLAICTDAYGNLSFTDMLDKVKTLGVDGIEMTAGGWGGCPHLNRLELLGSADKRAAFLAEIAKRGLEIAALNCSGNPLHPGEMGAAHTKNTYEVVELAGLLGVKKIVMMSGCPAGAPGDMTPNWITSTVSWPDYMAPALEYQWNEVAIPWWKKFVAHCQAHGVEQVAIEEFPCIRMNLEALNITTDHVGNFLKTTRMGAEMTRLINCDKLKLLYDVYHMQLNEGGIIDTLTEYIDQIGHVHVADAPGRHEPGTGEINYTNVFACLDRLGYAYRVGFELFPLTSTEEAVQAIMAC